MTGPLPEKDRAERLDAAIDEAVRNNGRVKSPGAHHAVVVYGGGRILMHLAFAVLTIFTCGLFAFPRIAWANTGRERRVEIRVDEAVNVSRTQ
ncbi:hypothetical protein [Mycobacterium sp. URHB0021]|jgi:hypothetical protein